MANGIDIVIGAEVSGALQGLQKVEAATVKAGATINKLPVNVSKATQSLSKLPAASNQATSALINLGRVAQDAPFGIIGIANNLNPLLESFQRTGQAAGGFVGALKALGGALLGGGGIGFLLSLVTGAMSYFAMGSRSATKETKELDEAAQKAAESQREFQQALDKASSATVSQAGEIANLKNILVSTGTTLEQITQATLNQALAQYLFTQKREILERVISDRLKNQLNIAKNTGENLGNYTFELEKASKIQPVKLATDEDWRRTGKGLTDTERGLLDINSLARSLGINLSDAFNQAFSKGKIKAPSIDFEAQFATVKMLGKPITIEGALLSFKNAQFGSDLLKGAEYGFNDRIKSMERLVKGMPTLSAVPNQKEIAEGILKMRSAYVSLGQSISSVVSPAIDEMIKSIGEGMNAFQAFGQMIVSIFKQVISKLIQTAILAAIISAISGGAGNAAKGGMSFIQAFKGAFGGFRAGGGSVSAGRSYIVGEREPELFVPSQNGTILNGNQIAAMSYSGGGSSGGGRQIVRGQNIILAYARTNRAQNRLGRG